MDCLDDQRICDWLEGRLPFDLRAAVEDHLDACPSCRTLVAAAAPNPRTQPDDGEAPPLLRGAAVDRYLILDVLGAGGMGVVYLAYDPELERKVALKLLRPGRDDATRRPRIQREAQAMARLTHPNVVAVHDVGTVGEQVFIVMEFVDGAPLSTWLREAARDWQAVVEVFVAAGRGLAAAHAAGLVHRDFKPENVLLDRRGRVLVGDFGLARAAGPGDDGPIDARTAVTDARVGTPAYMAPEQHRGEAVDARTDVFSFCVALYEALYGEHPFGGRTGADLPALREPSRASRVPSWLRAVVVRGLAREPDARHASMPALLAALERHPARRRRRALASALAAVVLVAAGLVGARMVAAGDRTCTGAGERLAGVWDDAQKRAVGDALRATGKPWAEDTWRTVEAALDDYARAWTAMHTQACAATRVTREQPEAILELRMRCLDERREGLLQLTRLLAVADATSLEHAARGVHSLRRLRDCADIAALSARVPPPADDLQRARVDAARRELAEVDAMHFAGLYRDGEARAARLVALARDLGYRPLLADALRTWALLLDRTGDYARAAEAMHEALLAAEAGRDRRLAAFALAELVWLRGQQLGQNEAALALGRHAAALLEGLGGDDELEGLLASNESAALGNLGRWAEAEASARLALQKRQTALGAEHFQVAIALNNLAATLAWMGRDDEALGLQQQALAMYGRIVGEHHPQYAHTLVNVASALVRVGRHEEAQTHAEQALVRLRGAFGDDHAAVAAAANMLGLIGLHRERPVEAQAHFERALAIAARTRDPDHPVVAHYTASLGEALAAQGRHHEALPRLYDAIARYERIGDPLQGARVRSSLAESLLATGAVDDAIAELERALQIQESGDPDPVRIAATRFTLAQALTPAGRDHARARELVAAVVAATASAGPGAADLHARARARQARGP